MELSMQSKINQKVPKCILGDVILHDRGQQICDDRNNFKYTLKKYFKYTECKETAGQRSSSNPKSSDGACGCLSR
jgi:hypothetical protein